MDRAFDHSEFREHLDAYLAGGLSPAEREAFDAHAARCDDCAGLLADAARRDEALRGLFADARPPADLEERLVDGLWGRTLRMPILHPAVRRAATAVAAVLVLGGFGYVASNVIHDGGLPTPWAGELRRVNTGGERVYAFRSPAQAPAGESDEGGASVERYSYSERFAQDSRAAPKSPAQMADEFSDFAKKRVAGDTAGGVRLLDQRRGRAAAVPGGMPVYSGYPGMAPGMAGSPPPVSAPAPARPEAAQEGKAVNDLHRAKRQPEALAKETSPNGRKGGAALGALRLGYAQVPGNAPDGARVWRDQNAGDKAVPADAPTFSLQAAVDPKAGKNLFGVAPGGAFKSDAYFWAAEAAKPQAAETLAQVVKEVEDRERQGQADPPSQAGQAQPAAPAPAAPVESNPTAGRKIIRNGEMTFEVDSFDSSYMQIVKIAAEEGGFVATTDSEKLANGKVKGTVTVRVPPERLDTLVLKLRGLGDLKSSRLAAQDITKQYTDLESQLKAARAMEERLLNIIKNGKGTIRELVEAEKQLGVYREKIEQVEGEIRYYNNLVSLSTLNITLIERDIRRAAMLAETEQVNMGVEAQDVEAARSAAIKAIEEAKGRIVESDLKKLEAGQFAGRVVADVPPDAAGPLIDRMKQIGTVARLEVTRKQSAPEGTVAPTPALGGAAVKVERRDTRFLISLYNLANVAPRQSTSLNLAADDVEAAYRTILEQVRGAGGRIVTSQLNRPRPDQTTGTITFEAPADGADVLLGAVRAAGEVMRLDVTQNPDAQNVTEAKRGFAVQIFSIASVAPRETTSLRVAARGVADAFNRLREAVRSAQGARILSSQLAEQDPASVTGTLDFDVRRQDWANFETALRDAGQVVSRNVTRSADIENTVDTKIRLQVVLVDEAALGPRESVTVLLAVADVPAEHAKLLEALGAAQARVLQSQLSEQQSNDNVVGTLAFDVRRENRAAIERAIAEAGDVVSRSVARSTDTQNTLDDKVRLSLTLTDADKLAPRETTTLGMEAADVEKAKEQVESLALSLGGRVVDSTLSRETSGRVTAQVVADVPLAKALEMVRRTRDQGRVLFRRDAREESVPQGSLARARVDVTLANEELIVESGQGLWSRIREGLRTSVAGLLWSVQLIVIGLFLVAPWALILYFAWRLIRRRRSDRTAPVPA